MGCRVTFAFARRQAEAEEMSIYPKAIAAKSCTETPKAATRCTAINEKEGTEGWQGQGNARDSE